VRDRAVGAGGLAGVTADADLWIDQVLLDDGEFGLIHVWLLGSSRRERVGPSRSAIVLPALLRRRSVSSGVDETAG
jgi:hypothetical protein